MRRVTAWWAAAAAVVFVLSAGVPAQGAEGLRLDCGTTDSPVMAGYERITGEDVYDEAKGYGWEGAAPRGELFEKVEGGRKGARPWEQAFVEDHATDLTRDWVLSEEDLVFRADVPDGTYRVTVTVGDLTEPLGSIDVTINGKLVGSHVAAWAVGGYRAPLAYPMGWWIYVRDTVEVTDGVVRIHLSKNQSYYDEQLAEQRSWEKSPYDAWRPYGYTREAPYNFIGWPFAQNSIMAIDILPYAPSPVVGENDKLRVTGELDSRLLNLAVSRFNEGDFEGAARVLGRVNEPEAQAAKAVLQLWLAGRLEVEMEEELVPAALKVLRKYVAEHPDANGVAEHVAEAEMFDEALTTHLMRGGVDRNHGIENDKAVGLWLTIGEGTPLYYKSQLYAARAAHMLVPYIPVLGMERQILDKLAKKFPDNRYVKYMEHWEWEQYGDGSKRDDWFLEDYYAGTEGSPEWARRLQAAFAIQVDWAEWWIKFKQREDGSVGGGWGDDVEVVGGFAMMAYVSKGMSEPAFEGTRKLVDGVWSLEAGVDPEIGYCLPVADVQHTAEWTGNTLGLMVEMDPGNPVWIERSLNTARLMRDLWTAKNDKGYRHFRSNFLGAGGIGSGEQMNDAWINLRATQPVFAVLRYSQNTGISKLFVELADAWHYAAMSTERGKPRGVIPIQVSFPEGIIGGTSSPNWYTGSHPPGTVNYDWAGIKPQRYKAYIHQLFLTAYEQTGDVKYLEPLKLEYELAARYGKVSETEGASRLLQPPWNRSDTRDGLDVLVTRWRPKYVKMEVPEPVPPGAAAVPKVEEEDALEEGSEEWIAATLQRVETWVGVKRMVEGRKGELENEITMEQILDYATYAHEMMKMRFPLMTTMASATDRVGFLGFGLPFSIYTGGGMGDAAVTYEDTTKYFAAAVMAADPQGLRILCRNMTVDAREIGLVPRKLELGGRYLLKYGPDADEDGEMDSVVERRAFGLPQSGMSVRVKLEPGITYVVEVSQVERGRAAELAPDPGLSARDIRFEALRRPDGFILAKIHNVGSKPVQNVEVAFYDGDPADGGTLLGTHLIPNIEAPNDLESRAVTIGHHWTPTEDAHEIYVVVDPNNEITDEITTLNNVAHTTLPKKEEAKTEPVIRRSPAAGGR
jgi:hypothetical protein